MAIAGSSKILTCSVSRKQMLNYIWHTLLMMDRLHNLKNKSSNSNIHLKAKSNLLFIRIIISTQMQSIQIPISSLHQMCIQTITKTPTIEQTNKQLCRRLMKHIKFNPQFPIWETTISLLG
jgi:hypothetical protein